MYNWAYIFQKMQKKKWKTLNITYKKKTNEQIQKKTKITYIQT